MIKLEVLLKEKSVLPYIMVGDGGIEESKRLLDLYVESGAKILEIGVPFSDPAADGKTIQEASKRARNNHILLKDCLTFISDGKKKYPHIGFVLMTYLNPILHLGIDNFFELSEADGLIIPDMPIEEYDLIFHHTQLKNTPIIPLISLDTPVNRMKRILEKSGGFVYLIALKGITGTQVSEVDGTKIALERLRSLTNLPIVAGFGIQTHEQVGNFLKLYDGVIIASEIIRLAQTFSYDAIKELISL